MPRQRTLLFAYFNVLCGTLVLTAVARGQAADAPRFGRHVVAVLDRLGCNAGACHGSFRGQNGFRLALFGGDPAMDYEFLARDAFGRRINRVAPERSLLLLKPTAQVPHGGGLRLHKDSAEYRLLRDWIAAGAEFDPDSEPAVSRIEVGPTEVILSDPSPQPLSPAGRGA